MKLYTDIAPYCCAVLRARVADGGLPPGEVWERDIKTLTAEELRPFTQVHLFCGIGGSPLGLKWAGWPDDRSIVTAGFPCQDVSNAGTRDGLDGERSGLYSESIRIVRGLHPDLFVMENSAALTLRGLDRVLGDLASIGYDAEWDCIPASSVGAPHPRDRIWIAAYPSRVDGEARDLLEEGEVGRTSPQPRGSLGFRSLAGRGRSDFGWPSPPDVCRVDDGVPGWVDRLEALGNAQVPQVVEVVARAMIRSKLCPT